MAGTLLKYLRISKYIRISLGTLLAGLLVSVGGWAQTANRQADKPLVSAKQDFCIHVMSGFPQSDQAVRYQFFRLSHSIARDATPEFRQLLSHYASTRISDTTPVRKVIEGMANPVLRQAAPKLVVAQSAWLIGFAKDCQAQIDGQIAALQAWDKDLKIVDFNTTV
ncbi:MAG TPA: hypothetical protein ENK01_00330, partial [Hellea balneolensis]|nr:hypothetical protein [Hellea balneolensis]